MSARVLAYLALGSNLGEREAHLAAARRALEESPQLRVLAASTIYETEPVGPPPQDWYLNAVLAVETDLAPRDLLARMLEIERAEGRARDASAVRWGARTLDLDLLLYSDCRIEEPGLCVPHPRLHERRFVLEPLADVAGDVVHPALAVPIRLLLERCSDHAVVRPWAGSSQMQRLPA